MRILFNWLLVIVGKFAVGSVPVITPVISALPATLQMLAKTHLEHPVFPIISLIL
jgi:hypothetical protein